MKKLSLICLLLMLVSITISINPNVYAALPVQMKGVYLWGPTINRIGRNAIIKDLKNYGFTDIFLLVKGNDGVVGYPSKVALSVLLNNGDQLKNTIKEAHKNKIRVHALFVVNNDEAWGIKHPEDLMVLIKSGPPSNNKISLLSPGYQKYLRAMVKEVVNNYDIDGVHLDYIRYSDPLYSFDKYMLDEAKRRKIDIEKVKTILSDSSTVLKAYQNGAPTLVAWEKLRRDTIVNFAKSLKKVVKSTKRPLYFSAALMPEGAIDPVFADVFYAQNYQDAASIYDFVIPMSYWRDYSKPPQWVGTVIEQAVTYCGKGRVIAGLQACVGVLDNKELAEAEAAAKANGSNGVVYFQYGAFDFASVQVKKGADGKVLVLFELTNRSEASIDNIEIDFNGTGLIPETVTKTPAIEKTQINNTSITLIGDQMLDINKTITFTVEVKKDQATKVSSLMPLIKLSARNKVFIPVYTVMK